MRRHLRGKVLLAVLTALLMSAAVGTSAQAAHEPPTLTWVSQQVFDDFCKAHGYKGVYLHENTAYGWICVTSAGKWVGINVGQVCAENNPGTAHVVA